MKDINWSEVTLFQEKVLKEVSKIPPRQTRSYQDIANAIGKPRAVRAVANAIGANPWAPKVPCHRVIRSDGSIGGYRYGIEKKRALLKAEGIEI